MNVQELVERLKAQELASLEAVELEAQAAEQEVDEEDIPREERVEIASGLELAFDGRLGSFQTVPLAVGVDASAWTSAVLVLLVHRTDGMADGSELRVSVQSIVLDPMEPSEIFQSARVAQAIWTRDARPPGLETSPLTPPLGDQLQVTLEYSQGLIAESAFPELATISVYLIGRLGAPFRGR